MSSITIAPKSPKGTPTLSFMDKLTLDDGRPLVTTYEGEPVTTSDLVAVFFEKEHKNVTRDIRAWLETIPEDQHADYFSPISITTGIGSDASREIQGYRMTEEGFALLGMSFTGEKAALFKFAYVKAFRLQKQEILRLQAENTNLLEQKLLKEQSKNANVKDRIQYLEGKKALFIDDKMNKFAQECALLDREARHEAEQELFELRCRLEGDERPKKSDYNARIKFVKTRCNNVQKRVKMLERLFKGTELEGEMVLCNALEGIVADIEFANHW